MRKHRLKISLALIAALVIGYGLLQFQQNSQAPTFTFTTLEGKKISMADLQGKLVLVNFWSINCLSCLKEMPELRELYQRYHGQGFELIAVAMDYDPPLQVLVYSQQKQLPFPVMHDGLGDISAAFGEVTVTPSHFLYNQQGQRLQRTIGRLDTKALAATLERELAKPN
ncbi:MAG: TlpA family protein disulfide reductase [Methylotenera sp.]|nr:TlpA family protein disulfide reductase [Methylotenera sp.]